MVDRATFDRIKQRDGLYASWAVWAVAGEAHKSNMGDLRALNPDLNPTLLQILTFAHTWLSNGGGESDLMRLTGWRSRSILERYGASAAVERAVGAHRLHSPGDRI